MQLTDDLPVTIPCKNCSNEDNNKIMKLQFLSDCHCVYICDNCDEVFPENGETIIGDVHEQPLTKSELKSLGLPVELLLHFPKIKIPLANKIIRVINHREWKYLDNLWTEFLTMNKKINFSNKEEFLSDSSHNVGSEGEDHYDISTIGKEELEQIEKVLDSIDAEKKVAELGTSANEDSEIEVMDTEVFFKKCDEIPTNPRPRMRQYLNKIKENNNKLYRSPKGNLMLKPIDRTLVSLQRRNHKTYSTRTCDSTRTLSTFSKKNVTKILEMSGI